MSCVLIVEDKESMAQMLKETLEAEGYSTIIAPDGEAGVESMKAHNPDVLLTDLKLPGMGGIGVLRASKSQSSLRPVIVMTAFGSVDTAVEAMKLGAFDFITKPFNIDHLLVLLARALKSRKTLTENMLMKEEFYTSLVLPDIIGSSPAINEVSSKIMRVAPTKSTVLLLGQSGTGKELFARAVHYLSDRKDNSFVPINCAAIPKDLLESELFGHEKGAFTGADKRKIGKFELADKGTVLLDEIGELDMMLQSKLLRVLQEGEIDRVGGTQQVKIDIRVVAASNINLERAVEEGKFREDLYYRINTFPVHIPPLRDRVEDIKLLADFFLNKLSPIDKPYTLSDTALKLLEVSPWKGNVRELENTIERAIILCDGSVIEPEHLLLKKGAESFVEDPSFSDKPLEEVASEALRIAESKRILKALRDTDGNKTKASALLGVSYKTLLTKIKDYGLDKS